MVTLLITHQNQSHFRDQQGVQTGSIDESAIPSQNGAFLPEYDFICDGDVPVFSLINQNGGRTFGVYAKGAREEFAQVNKLQQQRRIHAFGEANYEPNTQSYMWIMNAVEEIADTIVRNTEFVLSSRAGESPRHLDGQEDLE